MRAKQFCVLTTTESRAKIWCQKMHYASIPPVAKAAVRSKVLVLLLFTHCFIYLTLSVGFCVGLCFVMHYFVSFLVLRSFLRQRDSWLLCFNCLPDVMLLLVLCGSVVGRSAVCHCGIYYHTHLFFNITFHSMSIFQAKHLIMAIPPTLYNRIEFSPLLSPLKLQLIQRIPMGSIIKTTMYYETSFWRDLGN